MLLCKRVECSAKIAMRTLRACRDTTGLLLDLDQTRCIFLVWSAMHIFRSYAFSLHDVVIKAAMKQQMVNA